MITAWQLDGHPSSTMMLLSHPSCQEEPFSPCDPTFLLWHWIIFLELFSKTSCKSLSHGAAAAGVGNPLLLCSCWQCPSWKRHLLSHSCCLPQLWAALGAHIPRVPIQVGFLKWCSECKKSSEAGKVKIKIILAASLLEGSLCDQDLLRACSPLLPQ